MFNVRISSLTFVNVEHHGLSLEDRNAVFDLQCESEELGQFLVEVQVKQQEHFPERALFYSSYPILEQAPQGAWEYSISKSHTQVQTPLFTDTLSLMNIRMCQ